MATPGDISQIKFFSNSDSDDGDYTTTVAGVTGKKIRVLSLVATALTTAGVFSLKSATTVIFAQHLALGVPLVVVGTEQAPVCETASGAALIPSNAAGVDSFCNVTYVEVEP